MWVTPETPGPGQESVWDYPRPPRVESSSERIRVTMGGITIADSVATFRVLETSHPPVYYIPPFDVETDFLVLTPGSSFCEWKGRAQYYSLVVPGKTVDKAAWFYANPTARFTCIEGHLAFYPSKVDACYVQDELVRAQEGDFYGGWVTSKVVGPFKGAPGTASW